MAPRRILVERIAQYEQSQNLILQQNRGQGNAVAANAVTPGAGEIISFQPFRNSRISGQVGERGNRSPDVRQQPPVTIQHQQQIGASCLEQLSGGEPHRLRIDLVDVHDRAQVRSLRQRTHSTGIETSP